MSIKDPILLDTPSQKQIEDSDKRISNLIENIKLVYAYSLTDDEGFVEDLEDLLDELDFNEDDESVQVVTVFRGVMKPIKASDFFDVHAMLGAMGGSSEDIWTPDEQPYLYDIGINDIKSLDSAMKVALDKWATDNKKQPTWFNVTKTVEGMITVRRTVPDWSDCEIIGEWAEKI